MRRYPGFASDLHGMFGDWEDFVSLEGRGGIQDDHYLSIAQWNGIRDKLDERTGSYVERLAIPSFLGIADLKPFAQHCRNIQYLDISTFFHEIDADVGTIRSPFSPSCFKLHRVS